MISFNILLLIPVLGCYAKIESLTSADLAKLSNGEWMIEFFAPWCSACKAFEPIWKEFGDRVEKYDFDLHVVQVDIVAQAELAGQFFIKSIPTVIHVKNNQYRIYGNERSSDKLVSYIRDAEYLKDEPLGYWSRPDSFHMSLFSLLYRVSFNVKSLYDILESDYKVPAYGIYGLFGVAVIMLGITLGLMMVGMMNTCEFFYALAFGGRGKRKGPSPAPAHGGQRAAAGATPTKPKTDTSTPTDSDSASAPATSGGATRPSGAVDGAKKPAAGGKPPATASKSASATKEADARAKKSPAPAAAKGGAPAVGNAAKGKAKQPSSK